MFTWFITLLGALLVCFFKNVESKVMDLMLGLSAGVMIAASFWSLLLPALELSKEINKISWLLPSLGFLFGSIFLFFSDIIFKNILKRKSNASSMHKNILLIFSITLHNIPEGMAVGIAFGSLKYGLEGASMTAALMLALGIGIQNFPEGAAVSLPLKRNGMKTKNAFFLGQLSGFVEPIFAFLGALLAIKLRLILPFILTFAAGAMIYVVVSELIPESQSGKNKDMVSLFTLIGFLIMMILDVAFS
ncbi:MAG: ZIP family metal transporter [Bacilli bacterium]|nr:ZIP family metal transporter [Bacilli bacterium]